MSKEYLEAFKNLKQELYYSPNQIPDIDKWHETIEQALQRLNAIDNAEPSEAAKCLEELGEMYYVEADNLEESVITYANECDWFNTIKNCILKSQEPKQYLKWEELEFTYDKQKIKVKLNGENYTVVYFIMQTYDNRNGYEYVGILKDDDIVVYSINGYLYTANLLKQFFNNLHLEKVE